MVLLMDPNDLVWKYFVGLIIYLKLSIHHYSRDWNTVLVNLSLSVPGSFYNQKDYSLPAHKDGWHYLIVLFKISEIPD